MCNFFGGLSIFAADFTNLFVRFAQILQSLLCDSGIENIVSVEFEKRDENLKYFAIALVLVIILELFT